MSEKQDRKTAARRKREAAEAAARLKESRRRRLQLAGGGFATIAVVAGVAIAAVSGGGGGTADGGTARTASIPAPRITDLGAAAKAAGATFTSYRYSYGTGDHMTGTVKYPTNPPTNGPHNPMWASDGNYVGAATPQTEQLVHALEHGRIEIQYRPGLPQAQIDQLVALYDEDPAHVLLFENKTGMDCDVGVTAWSHGMLCKSFGPGVFDAVRAFRDEYRDQGPEKVA